MARLARDALLPLLVVILGGLAFKAPELFLPMGEDQGIFNYGGLLLMRGGLLYRDYWETKPPAEFLVHGLTLWPLARPWDRVWFGDSFTTGGQLALNAVDFAWSVATALAVYAVARAGMARPFAWCAALLAIVHMNAIMLSQEGSIAEKHLLLPCTLAVWAYQRYLASTRAGWLVASGALVGAAILFKQPAAMTGLALAAFSVLRALQAQSPDRVARWLREEVLLAVGLVLALAPLVLWLSANSLLADFWTQTIVFNLGQAAEHPSDFSGGLMLRSWRVISESSGLLWLLGLIGVAVALARRDCLALLWLVWAVANLGAILWGGAKLSQPYYLYVVPSFAVLGGLAAEWLWRRPLLRQHWWWRSGLVLAAALVLIASSSFQRRVTLRVLHERFPAPAQTSMVEEVGFSAPLLPRDGSLYIWGGETQLYLLSGSSPPTRHLHGFFLSKMHSVDPSYLERRAELVDDLRRDPPRTILIDPRTEREDPDGTFAFNLSTFPELQALLAERYEPLPNYKDWRGFQLR